MESPTPEMVHFENKAVAQAFPQARPSMSCLVIREGLQHMTLEIDEPHARAQGLLSNIYTIKISISIEFV